jgi:hypothetical protein
VPRGEYANTEKLAVEIVRDDEFARGWTPGPLLGQRAQHAEGCDLFSTPPDGGPPHRIEVKGWGEPLLAPNGAFNYPADVNREQYERATSDPNWRLEIVGNLAAVRASTGQPERLTLTGEEVVRRAECWRYRIPLDGLTKRIRKAT